MAAAASSSLLTVCFFLLLLHGSAQGKRMLRGATVRDVFAPVTNPVTVPATNPASPGGGVVTVPSTNPPLYPDPTTMPDPGTATTIPSPFTNPAPFVDPTAPVTNPATTPTVTNPATTYPYPPQGSSGGGGVGFTPPTAPTTTVQPAAPTVSGQTTWCVAKTGITETALQSGLDYACGIADCSALQPMGACYNPNTMQAHASYAFNTYFQRNPSPASCDFGGAGMLVTTNPSSGACVYQTSSSAGSSGAVYSPAVTGTGPVGTTPGYGPVSTTPGYGPPVSGGSGSTVLNSNNNPSGTSIYGSDNPPAMTASAASLSCSWVLFLVWMFTFAYVKEKV